jgi:hypothetical protein
MNCVARFCSMFFPFLLSLVAVSPPEAMLERLRRGLEGQAI